MRIRGSRLQQEMLDAADKEWVEGRGPGLSKASTGCSRGGLMRLCCRAACLLPTCAGCPSWALLNQPPAPTQPTLQVYDALNALGSTPWSINPDVFRVVETGERAEERACCAARCLPAHLTLPFPSPAPTLCLPPTPTLLPCAPAVWAWGGGVCDIPPKLNLVPPPELRGGFRQHRPTPGQLQFYVSGAAISLLAVLACFVQAFKARLPTAALPLPTHPRRVQSVPRGEVRERRAEIARVAKKNRELHSLRCDMEYKLAIAR